MMHAVVRLFLAIGVVSGGLSYIAPLTSRRERRIR
jgi:hypothetical protein